ncbi:calcium-binding protein [Glaesserella sp.]|uniref:calcium-binding protein n=1 Tax=Glaesserella sp. TaxID=2094731 RepID=UPI0035A0214F
MTTLTQNTTMPSAFEIVSLYLWGQKTPPTPGELAEGKWIRPLESTLDITIDAQTYMKNGAGRFVTPANYKLLTNFFNKRDIPDGMYDIKKIWGKIYGIPYSNQELILSMSQYELGVWDEDYVDRAYVFGSTLFKLDKENLTFVVRTDENGQKHHEVHNLKISPEQDNFDYESSNLAAKITNKMTKFMIDPSGIGRKVNLVFSGVDNLKTIPVLTEEEFRRFEEQAEKEKRFHGFDRYMQQFSNSDSFTFSPSAYHSYRVGKFLELMADLHSSGVINYLDEKGRYVRYDGANDGGILEGKLSEDDTISSTGRDYTVNGATYSGAQRSYIKNALVGGVRGDILVGGHNDDLLIGNDGDDILDSGEGNDTVLGGDGFDTYYIGEGDTIIDTDGKGSVYFVTQNNQEGDLLDVASLLRYEPNRNYAVFEGISYSGNRYRYEANNIKFSSKISSKSGLFSFISESLTITQVDNSGAAIGKSLQIKDFKNGDLGINLLDIPVYYNQETHEYYFHQDSFYFHLNDFPSLGKLISNSMPVDYYAPPNQPEGERENPYDLSSGSANNAVSDNQGGWGGNEHADSRADGSDLNSPDEGATDNNSNGERGNVAPNKPGRNYEVYDPLVLDLDGDGIETVSHNGKSGALFDHDLDGIRTATGWLKSDDGFLVFDRNQDGSINNSSELFSDRVLLADSTYSKHGFSALAELDENDDGIVNRLDSHFSGLQIWRDINQDGESSSEELFSLEQFGIGALHTEYEQRSDELTGNNFLSQLGRFEKVDGSFGVMGDVNFSFNPFYSQFIDKVDFSAIQHNIVNLSGVGRIRDLKEAAALSKELSDLLQQYAVADTRQSQLELLPNILNKWAETDQKYSHYDYILEKTVESTSQSDVVVRVTPGELARLRNAQHNPEIMQRFEENKHKIATINSLYNLNIKQLYYTTDKDIDYITDKINRMYQNSIEFAYQSLLFQTRLKRYANQVYFFKQNNEWVFDYSRVIPLFLSEFERSPINALTDLSEYISLMTNPVEWNEGLLLLNKFVSYAKDQTWYSDWKSESTFVLSKLEKQGITLFENWKDKDYKGNDIVIGDSENNVINAGRGNDTLIGGLGNDTLNGSYGSDTYLFAKGHGQDVINEYAEWNDRHIDTIRFSDVNYDEVKFRRENNDLVLFDYHEGDSLRIKAFYEHNYYEIERFEFADRNLTLAEMKTEGIRLFGTEGDDVIYDWNAKAIIDAGSGNDTINAGRGDDKLIGGLGNDTLNGSYGSDTYLFAKGHGQDVINEYAEWNDGRIDIIQFKDLNESSQLWFSRKNNDLVIQTLSTLDQVTVKDWYTHRFYKVEKIKLADGRGIDMTQVEKLVDAMASFSTAYSSDISQAPKEEMDQYIAKLAVQSYWS